MMRHNTPTTDSYYSATVTVHDLQLLVEQEKTALAREIHDDLGGHLISTAMDLALLRRRFSNDPEGFEKIERATRSLNAAVDMMRRVTEELHPTLLDNVGLFSAIRWQIKQMCRRSNVLCKENLPETEPRLSPATAITLFRVAQEALVVAENQVEVTAVDFAMSMDDDVLTMRVCADGLATPPVPSSRGYVALEFLRHRIDAMNGTVVFEHPPEGGMSLTTEVQFDSVSTSDTRAVRILETWAAMPAASSTG